MIADRIADWLAAKGVTHAFGIIGAGNIALWDAISRKKKTEIICCHHEQAAVLAAGFYYRTCGRIAAAIVTTGAGQSNAITGVISCWMDSTPVLILSGNEPSKFMGGSTRVLGAQGFDVAKMMKDHVKYMSKPRSWGAMEFALEVGYKMAVTPRKGPAWIDISRDIACLNQ